jgi:hypothetical protein
MFAREKCQVAMKNNHTLSYEERYLLGYMEGVTNEIAQHR